MAGLGDNKMSEARVKAMAFPNDLKVPSKRIHDTDAGYGIIEGTDPNDKLKGIVAIVELVSSKLALKGSAARVKAPKERPWLTSETPKQKITKLKEELWVSQRMVEFHETHLAAHVVAHGSIERQLAVALSEEENDLDGIPETLQAFFRQLNRFGLLSESVRNMSNADAEMIARALNNRRSSSSDVQAEAFGFSAHQSNRITDEHLAATEAACEALQPARLAALAALEAAREPIQRVDPEPPLSMFGQSWDDMSTPVPSEFWESDLTFDLPYRWGFRKATRDEAGEVFGMPMPSRDTWVKMVATDTDFAMVFKDDVVDPDLTLLYLNAFLSHRYNLPLDGVPSIWPRAWLFMLWARTQPEAAKRVLGDRVSTYFAGQIYPASAMGASFVRVLKTVAE